MYAHLPEQTQRKDRKDYVDADGKVRTELRNIMVSSLVNIQNQRDKEFKYMPNQAISHHENHKKRNK
jgi:hypothetical protein